MSVDWAIVCSQERLPPSLSLQSIPNLPVWSVDKRAGVHHPAAALMVATDDAADAWLDWADHLISIRRDSADWAPVLEILCRLVPADGARISVDDGAFRVFNMTVGGLDGANQRSSTAHVGRRQFSLTISRQDDDFNQATELRWERLFEQLRKSLEVQDVRGRSIDLLFSLRSALERLPIGALIVDATLAVRLQTEGARQLLARRDGLSLTDTGAMSSSRESPEGDDLGPTFGVMDPRADADLRACIQRLNRPGEASREHMISVARTSGRPYGLLIARLDRSGPDPDFLVLVSDPDAPLALQPEALRRLYRLTPAESRLCAALANGDTLKSYAEAEGVSLETVRSQLKQAMVKTSTHKQAQLVRLLVTGPAAYTS